MAFQPSEKSKKKVQSFFKKNIYTFGGKGELLITIMSSLAQEERRWISVNVTWGKRKRFADGKVSMPYKRFPGYERGEDGSPKINESEAVIVRLIYRLLMKVKTTSTRSFFCLIFFVIPHRLHRLLRSNHPSLAIACNFALSSTNIR